MTTKQVLALFLLAMALFGLLLITIYLSIHIANKRECKLIGFVPPSNQLYECPY